MRFLFCQVWSATVRSIPIITLRDKDETPTCDAVRPSAYGRRQSRLLVPEQQVCGSGSSTFGPPIARELGKRETGCGGTRTASVESALRRSRRLRDARSRSGAPSPGILCRCTRAGADGHSAQNGHPPCCRSARSRSTARGSVVSKSISLAHSGVTVMATIWSYRLRTWASKPSHCSRGRPRWDASK
jgi:hypothetical protein